MEEEFTQSQLVPTIEFCIGIEAYFGKKQQN